MYIDQHNDWGRHLDMAEFMFNSSKNRSVGCSPFELNYGFAPKTPEDLFAGKITSGDKEGDGWLTKLASYLEKAKENIENIYVKYKKHHDGKRRVSKDKNGDVIFAPKGSFVYLSTSEMQNTHTIAEEAKQDQNDKIKRKLLSPYVGPFEVEDVCGTNKLNRKLKLSSTLKKRLKHDEFRVSRLKLAWDEKSPFDFSIHVPPPTQDGEFTVEAIVGYNDGRYGREFLVKWLGYEEKFNTWEPEANMENASESIKEFMITNPQPIRRTRTKSKKK